MPGQAYFPTLPLSGRVTPAAFPFYTSGEESLCLKVANSQTGVVVAVSARVLDEQGRAIPQAWTFAPTADRAVTDTYFDLSGRTILNVTMYALAGAPKIGQCFCILMLVRGTGDTAIPLGTILQGYITGEQAIAWPGSPIQTSIEGEGYPRSVQGTIPAPGLEIHEQVPAGARWALQTIATSLNAAAGGPNRFVELAAADAIGLTKAYTPNTFGQAPATFFLYGWSTLGAPVYDGVNRVILPWPITLILLAGETIRTYTGGLAAGDQWGQPSFTVREWLEVQG